MSEEHVHLGLMPPFSGLVEIYGREIYHAAKIACQEINDEGGVLGKKLKLIIEDDGSLPESSVKAAERLVNQGCVAIIGNLLSNSRIAVAYRVAEPLNIPYLNFSFYEGSIISRYFFNFAALPNQQIEYMIPYMCEHHGPRMYFAGNNYEWPRGSIHEAKTALLHTNGCILGEKYYPIGIQQSDIHHILNEIEVTKPDVFVPYFAGNDQIKLLTEFYNRGLKDQSKVVMGHFDEMMASQLTPQVREGLYSSNTYFMSIDTPRNRLYKQALADLDDVHGLWPNGNGISTNFGEGAYICVKAFAYAANSAGRLDAESLVEALKMVKVNAPQGLVEMNSQHHHAKVNSYLTCCGQNGEFTVVKTFGAIEPELPERYRHQIIMQHSSLEDSIRLQSRMLENMTEAVILLDIHTQQILYSNNGANRLFNLDADEILTLKIDELIGSDILPITDIINHRGGWKGDLKIVSASGLNVWCSGSITLFTHPYLGEVSMVVLRDVTDQKNAEHQISRIEKRFAHIAQATPVGIFQTDNEGNCIFVNNKWLDITGNTLAGAMGTGWTETLHPDDKQKVFDAWQSSVINDWEFSLEYRFIKLDGTVIWVYGQAQSEKDQNGKIIAYVGTITDITNIKNAENKLHLYQEQLEKLVEERTSELAQAQEQLLRKEKLATLGQLTAAISHELRNPLSILTTQMYIIKKYYDLREDKLSKSMNIFENNLHRCNNIIDQLLDYSRIRTGNLHLIELDQFLAKLLDEIFSSHQNVALCTDFGLQNVKLELDTELFRRVIINLSQNAIEAFAAHKANSDCQVKISTQNHHERITISIEDNGCGMDAATLDRLFEPLFSTKTYGVGLGMPIVKQIMDQHLGQIEVRSNLGAGTRVILTLFN